MNLFTYLLSKKGKNSLVYKGDLFAYLLGKRTPQEVKTATGTTISISDATKEKIIKLTLDKESSQETTIGKNLLSVRTENYDNYGITLTSIYNENGLLEYYLLNGTLTSPSNVFVLLGSYSGTTSNSYRVTGINDYTNLRYRVWKGSSYSDVITDNGLITTDAAGENYAVQLRVATGVTYTNVKIYPMVRLATIENPTYEPYTNGVAPNVSFPTKVNVVTGNVYIIISDGVDSETYTIPLNGNEIVGIGGYKDELIVDSDGHCYLNKKVGKILLNGTETWSKSSNTNVDRYVTGTGLYKTYYYSLSNYFRNLGQTTTVGCFYNNVGTQLIFNFASYGTTTLLQWKEWLSEHNVICYQPLKEEQLIDLNYTIDMRLFNGVNNISNSDDMDMTLEYY